MVLYSSSYGYILFCLYVKSIEEQFRKHVDTMVETEQKLDRLQAEKKLLESSLQLHPRTVHPRMGGKLDRETRLLQV